MCIDLQFLSGLVHLFALNPLCWGMGIAGLLIFGYTWTTKVANVTTVAAADVNNLQTEKMDRDGNIPLTGVLQWDKGANVASAATLALGSDGNYFGISGTTGISGITQSDIGGQKVQAGTVVKLYFYDACILTHGANFHLPFEINYTTAEDDELEFVCFGEDQWRCTNISSNVLKIGNATTASVDPVIVIARNLSAGSGNAHAFSDSTNLSRTGTMAYNSFDGRITISGSADYNHYAAFQSAPTFSTSGTTAIHYGFISAPTITAGTITNLYHHHVTNATGAGAVTNQYGLYVAELTKGATLNYAVYTAGTTKSYFGGWVGFAIVPSAPIHLSAAGASTTSYEYIDNYCVTAGYTGGVVIRKSHSDTSATVVETVDTEVLGIVDFKGASTTPAFAYGARILAVQSGNAGTYVPTNLYLRTYSNSAVHTNQLVLNTSGYVGVNDAAPGEQFDVGGNIDCTGVYKVDDVQVVGARVIDARCDDVINSGDATTDGVIDALRDAMIAHGLIAAA